MRAAHKTKLRLCGRVIPDDGIRIFNSFYFRVVHDVNFRILFYKCFPLFFGFRRQIFDVIKPDRAVRCRRRAEVFEIRASIFREFRAEVLVKPDYVRHVLQNLHAYRRTQKLSLGFFRRLYFDNPVGLSSLVG